jgi:Protein of unknown function (DUF3455)
VRNSVESFVVAGAILVLGGVLSAPCGAQDIPKQLQPPSNETLVVRVHAKGVQIYSCQAANDAFSWTLKAPDAQLTDKDGKSFGKHFAGPSWEANDGSRVVGKAVANVPSPDADSIPWLLVTVTSHSGEGMLARISSIQRLATKGGKAPASGCDKDHVGQEARVPYTADYLFFAPK